MSSSTTREARMARLFEAVKAQALIHRGAGGARPMHRSGRPAKWLFDIRQVLLSGEGLSAIAAEFWDRFEDRWPFQVGGIEFSGAPLVAGIQLEGLRRGYEVNGFVVRKERKTTGLCRQYEGRLDDRPIVAVDDLLNSGSSLERVFSVLSTETRTVSEIFTVLDFEAQPRPGYMETVPVEAQKEAAE